MLPDDPRREEELTELREQLRAAVAQNERLQRESAALQSQLEEQSRGAQRRKRSSVDRGALQASEVDATALRAIIERTRGVLEATQYEQLKAVVDAFVYISRQLETSTVTLARLKRFLFGTSEKTSQVLGDTSEPATTASTTEQTTSPSPAATEATPKPKAPGHGRLAAAAYTGATKIPVTHPQYHHGDQCPHCQRGRVYGLKEPRALVRVTGVAPLSATVYECEQLRCNACQEIFAAPPPEGVGTKKYDESATSMIALAKYGVGLPFNRIEKLQHAVGVPMPATTQWELVEQGAKDLLAVFQELVRQGAAAEVLHNDDTSMKVLELSPEQREQLLGEKAGDRTGVFTSGVVAKRAGGEHVALYYTGPRHSGENLARLLEKRSEELPPPTQMCDALAANVAGEFETIVANCLAHGRRHFVDVAPHFPQECRFVLETLRDVYRNDAETKRKELSPADRLLLHQERSAPLMELLRDWLNVQLDDHRVEPNSSLGEALRYLRKHWDKLTLFLRRAGAPLDNNICERALKRAILHRKNSLFYRTLQGAAVGDLYMSLIHTCELNKVSAFEYLVALLQHPEAISKKPTAWMPWNYCQEL
jgi:transposase